MAYRSSKKNDRCCTHCERPDGQPVFPATGGTDAAHTIAPMMPLPLPDKCNHPITGFRGLPNEVIDRIVDYIRYPYIPDYDDSEATVDRTHDEGSNDDVVPADQVPSAIDEADEDERVNIDPAEYEEACRLDNAPPPLTHNSRWMDRFRDLWLAVKGARGSCRRLYHAISGYLSAYIARYPNDFPRFRVVEFEYTADSLATLAAIVRSPLWAPVIREIHAVVFQPYHLLSNEEKFKSNVRKALREDLNFHKNTEFETECAIQAAWFEAREYAFEQFHVLTGHHDEAILTAAAPLLTSLDSIRYTITKTMARSYYGRSSLSPDFGEKTNRPPIQSSFLHQNVQHWGLGTLAKVFAGSNQIKRLSMIGVDVDIAKLRPKELGQIERLVSQVIFLELEAGSDRKFGSNETKHTQLVARCQKLFAQARSVQHLVLGFDRQCIRYIKGGRYTNFEYQWTAGNRSELLEAILTTHHSPDLIRLSVQWLSVEEHLLVKFLDRHSKTLSYFCGAYLTLFDGPKNAADEPRTSLIEQFASMDKLYEYYLSREPWDHPGDEVLAGSDNTGNLDVVKRICKHSQSAGNPCREHPFVRYGAVLKKWYRDFSVRDGEEMIAYSGS